MRTGKLLAWSAAVTMTFGLAMRAPADTILNTGGTTKLTAAVGGDDLGLHRPPAESTQTPNALPYLYSENLTTEFINLEGQAFINASKNSYTLRGPESIPGGITQLAISMEHRYDGFDVFASSMGSIFFSVTQETTYALDGFYSVVDRGLGNEANFAVNLTDLTTSTGLFENTQFSKRAHNTIFGSFNLALGQTGGDALNTLSGSQTGTLVVGHEYRFGYEAHIFSNRLMGGDNGNAFASGDVLLTLTDVDPAPVPLPTAVWGGFVLLGGLGLTKFRRRYPAASAA